MNRRVRFAVVGLGHIARGAILPGFAGAPAAELATVISGSATKRQEICAQYNLVAGYAYNEFEAALQEQRCDAVFIALPNQLHREYTERALRAGAHVLCEKPLAVTADDCEALAQAAETAQRKLMVAYRHHFADAWREVMQVVNSGRLGELRSAHSLFTISIQPGSHKTLAENGGTLPDIGIYCINTLRNVMGESPAGVHAFTTTRTRDSRFHQVEEMFTAVMEFSGARLATFTCEFGAARVMSLQLVGTNGSLYAEPFYDYKKDIRMEIRIDGEESQVRIFPRQDQFSLEIEHFAQCILNDSEPSESASEALADTRVMEQLWASARPSPQPANER